MSVVTKFIIFHTVNVFFVTNFRLGQMYFKNAIKPQQQVFNGMMEMQNNSNFVIMLSTLIGKSIS